MNEVIKRTQYIRSEPFGPVVSVRYSVHRVNGTILEWSMHSHLDDLRDCNVAMDTYARWDAQALDQFAMWYANEGWGDPPTDIKR